jgi:hypothetical protein
MKDVSDLLEDFCIEDKIDFENKLVELGYVVSKAYFDYSIESYSTNVNWEFSAEFEKDSEIFNMFLYGEAMADISYDRWVDTFGYTMTSYNMNKLIDGRWVSLINETK